MGRVILKHNNNIIKDILNRENTMEQVNYKAQKADKRVIIKASLKMDYLMGEAK